MERRYCPYNHRAEHVMTTSKNTSLKKVADWMYAHRTILMIMGIMMVSMACFMGMHADTILGKASAIADSVLKSLNQLYCYRLAPLVIVISVIIMAVSKNDKLIGAAKQTLIYALVAFFVIMLLNPIFTTINGYTNEASQETPSDKTWTFQEGN